MYFLHRPARSKEGKKQAEKAVIGARRCCSWSLPLRMNLVFAIDHRQRSAAGLCTMLPTGPHVHISRR